MSEINLQQFCGKDECQLYLSAPFSVNGFTYATNGYVMVRVAQRADVPIVGPDFPKVNWNKPLTLGSFDYRPSRFSLPERAAVTGDGECPRCDGRGTAHDCPDCDCDCECGLCSGTGNADPEADISTKIGNAFFDLRYVRQILSLPNVEVAPPIAEELPMQFRFDGGIGAVMPLRGSGINHIEIEAEVA